MYIAPNTLEHDDTIYAVSDNGKCYEWKVKFSERFVLSEKY